MRTLVITEKFSTALRIAIVLSDGHMKRGRAEGMPLFTFERPDGPWAVAGLRGHIVELDFPEELSRWSLDGLPRLLDSKPLKRVTVPRIVDALKSIIREYDRLVLATDFDREGELIGVECLELLREVHPTVQVRRARYSALTREEIERSFAQLADVDHALADAAGARQEIDLLWGALLTRYLTLSSEQRGHGFLSAGRVQTPTLALLVERDQEIRTFVPTPFWELFADAVEGTEPFTLGHTHGRFEQKQEADRLFAHLRGATEGVVRAFTEEESRRRPPIPFSTTLFVAEASRMGIGAAHSMRVAEDLYTHGIISYPRTDNTVYPRGLGLRSMVERFLDSPFRTEAEYLLKQSSFRPTRGRTETTDHPPIYPTAVVDPKKLKPDHARLYELVVRRFFATLAPDCVGRARHAAVEIRGEPFEGRGLLVTDPGWYSLYPYSHPDERALPVLQVGATLKVNSIRLEQSETKPPRPFTQGTLIQEMEKLGLGTKSTRHDVLQKLLERRYISLRNLEPTGTGIAVTEALRAHAPVITRPEMTHRLEEEMALVAESKKPQAEVISDSREMLREALDLLQRNTAGVRATLQGALDQQHFAGPCPRCGGALRLARSPRGSRWMQCVNNPATCPVSYTLPAAGFIEPAPEFLCPTCKTPRLKITFRGQRPDLYCVNPECAEHKRAFEIGTCPSCGSPLAIRHSFAGKRFVGCTGYPQCRVTYPLPQRGKLERSPEPCPVCRSPIVTAIEAGRRPWTLCINPACPSRDAKKAATPASEAKPAASASPDSKPATPPPAASARPAPKRRSAAKAAKSVAKSSSRRRARPSGKPPESPPNAGGAAPPA
ncbi:MAG TPA: DNA topoisomerase I [Thermoplasmata archaeon]|nr:DNA topoisomerase I [Thermoplasmata archaeon]